MLWEHERQVSVSTAFPGSPKLQECFYYFSFFRCLDCAQRFDYRALDSSQKLGGADERLFEGDEKRTCQLTFEY